VSSSDWSDYWWRACPQVDCSDARACMGYLSPPFGCLVPASVRRGLGETMPITKENLKATMSYHALDDEQKAKYTRVQDAAEAFATVCLEVVGPCGDQQAAIRHIFEAKATINRSIAIRGAV
jgi:hypothetical protein